MLSECHLTLTLSGTLSVDLRDPGSIVGAGCVLESSPISCADCERLLKPLSLSLPIHKSSHLRAM